jgi:hypothetical protein
MKQLNGLYMDFDFSGFTKVADLIYYEGPLLSYYVSPKGENYMFYWADVDDTYNRWMVLRVDSLTLKQFILRKITLKELVTNPIDGTVFFVDIDDRIHYHHICLVPAKQIPEEYTPKDNTYYDIDFSHDLVLKDLALFSEEEQSILSESEEIETVGRFYCINIKDGTYSFESTKGRTLDSCGYIDSKLKDVLYTVSFNKEYWVTILRRPIRHNGSKEMMDTIVKYSELRN